jgi:hypothetical protein
MDFKRDILSVFFIMLLSSCSMADKIPIAPLTHIPLSALWMQIIDRRINYVPNVSEVYKENMVNIKNEIYCSVNAAFTKASGAIIYGNYSSPFSFQIIMNKLNKKTDKIVLKQCTIKITNEEIRNILEIPMEDISIEFSWRSNDGHRGWGQDYKGFNNTMEIAVEKKPNEYIDGVYLYFHDIPINYETDSELLIIYEFEFYFNEEKNIVRHEIQYIRKIEEAKMYHFIRNRKPDEEWHEISMEEWKKHL